MTSAHLTAAPECMVQENGNKLGARGCHDAFPALLGMHHGFDARLSSAQLFHSTPSSQERIRISDSVHKEALHHEITNTHDSGGTGVGRKQFADYDLTGRVFIATGGAQGLGLSMAEALADAGGKVYCLDRAPRPDEAWDEAQSRLVTEWVGSLHYKQQDITDTAHLDETITAIAEENQRLDGVIAAAGIQQLHRSFDDGKFGSTPNAQVQMQRQYLPDSKHVRSRGEQRPRISGVQQL
ncbi:hypothetical protein FJTKL_08573 [Diaporthe vaccinii]|uniref:Uncharacterized protein n=1 Tax=Diaporthe vaccinii TaxID=105482 RepID=A0ABR4ERI0_9PEZI